MISSKQRLYFRFSQLDGLDTREPFAMKGMYSMPSSASGRTTDEINPRHNKSAAIDDSYSFTPTLFASFRYGYTRTNLDAFADGNRYDARDMKMPEVVLANQVSGGYPMIAMGENMPQFGSRLRASVNDTHSLYITFNQLAGRHTIKYGLDTRVVRWHENAPGEIAERPLQLRYAVHPLRSHHRPRHRTPRVPSMGALLLGLPNDAQIGYNSALSLQSWYTALYFQDDLKVTPRLTLNLGAAVGAGDAADRALQPHRLRHGPGLPRAARDSRDAAAQGRAAVRGPGRARPAAGRDGLQQLRPAVRLRVQDRREYGHPRRLRAVSTRARSRTSAAPVR